MDKISIDLANSIQNFVFVILFVMLSFLLNLPYTLLGLLPAIISGLQEIKFDRKNLAFIIKVKKFWWAFGYYKSVRAMTIGHLIILGPRLLKNDLEHELIHVNQCQKYPFIFPILYFLEMGKGPRWNKFEEEAYRLSNSTYEGGK